MGQTIKSLYARWRYHVWLADRKFGSALHRAIKKYGLEAFNSVQIDVAESLEELNRKETYHFNKRHCLVCLYLSQIRRGKSKSLPEKLRCYV